MAYLDTLCARRDNILDAYRLDLLPIDLITLQHGMHLIHAVETATTTQVTMVPRFNGKRDFFLAIRCYIVPSALNALKKSPEKWSERGPKCLPIPAHAHPFELEATTDTQDIIDLRHPHLS